MGVGAGGWCWRLDGLGLAVGWAGVGRWVGGVVWCGLKNNNLSFHVVSVV